MDVKIKVQRLLTIGFALCLCAFLGACGAASPPEDGDASEEESPSGPPNIVMAVRSHDNGSVIEIPQFDNSRGSDALAALNERILEFAGDYERFIENADDVEWLELKCYPLSDDDYAQVVLTRVVYPTYGDYGDVASFCYDYRADAEFTPEEAAAADGMDFSSPESGLTDALPTGEFEPALAGIEPAAFAASREGNLYFLNVYFDPPEEGEPPRKDLFVRYPDGNYGSYDGDVLSFGPLGDKLRAMDPPLYYE